MFKRIFVVILIIANIGLPFVSADGSTGEKNVALGKLVADSVFFESGVTAPQLSNLTDGDVDTFWSCKKMTGGAFFIIDLGEQYYIDRFELVARQDDVNNPKERQNFTVSLSNDTSFDDPVLAGGLGFGSFPKKGIWKWTFNGSEKYRYVMVKKTNQGEPFSVAEFRVFQTRSDEAAGISSTQTAVSTFDLATKNMFKRNAAFYYLAGQKTEVSGGRIKFVDNTLYATGEIAYLFVDNFNGLEKIYEGGYVYYNMKAVAERGGVSYVDIDNGIIILTKDPKLLTSSYSKDLYESINNKFKGDD